MAGELVDQPTATGQTHNFSTFEFDVLAILLLVVALSIFQKLEILIYRMVWVPSLSMRY